MLILDGRIPIARDRTLTWLWFCAALVAACSHQKQSIPEPPPPPADVVTLVGNGERVAGPVGPKGGRLALSPDGPWLEIPADAVGGAGKAFQMRKDPGPGHPAAGVTLVGPLLLVSPSLTPASSSTAAPAKTITLSLALPALPAGRVATELQLAVEKAGDVGPADGTSAPALAWEYVRAEWKAGRAVAALNRLRGMRMQFLFRSESHN